MRSQPRPTTRIASFAAVLDAHPVSGTAPDADGVRARGRGDRRQPDLDRVRRRQPDRRLPRAARDQGRAERRRHGAAAAPDRRDDVLGRRRPGARVLRGALPRRRLPRLPVVVRPAPADGRAPAAARRRARRAADEPLLPLPARRLGDVLVDVLRPVRHVAGAAARRSAAARGPLVPERPDARAERRPRPAHLQRGRPARRRELPGVDLRRGREPRPRHGPERLRRLHRAARARLLADA